PTPHPSSFPTRRSSDLVGTRDDFVIEFTSRPRDRALHQHAFVAGYNRGDVLPLLQPGAKQYRNITARCTADDVGTLGYIFGTVQDRKSTRLNSSHRTIS